MANFPKVSVITIGADDSAAIDLLNPLFSHNSIQYFLISSNLLDYSLPPKIENGAIVWHRDELRSIIKKLIPNTYSITESLRDLLMENDRLELDELDLAIVNHINQIENNSANLEVAYELLIKEANLANLSLYPLVSENIPLLAFKNKKYAPVRYYFQRNELLKEEPPPKLDQTKRKYDDKKLAIENFDQLKNIKLSEKAKKALQQSDLILIFPTDILSFAFHFKASELEKQLKKVDSPIVLLWPFQANREPSKVEQEITTSVGLHTSLVELSKDIAKLTDYIIIDKSDKDYVDELREVGCHVLVSDLSANSEEKPEALIQTIFNIGNIIEKSSNDNSSETHLATHEKKINDSKPGDEDLKETDQQAEVNDKKSKSIAQLLESPQEAGKGKITDEETVKETNDLKEVESDITEETDNGEEIKSKTKEVVKTISPKEKLTEESSEKSFSSAQEEEWIDTVKRGIENCFNNMDVSALDWLINQSKIDNDNEVQIAGEVVKVWLSSRSNVERRKGAEIVSKLAKESKDTYLQIIQRHMYSAVQEGEEDKRRRLIQMISMLNEVDTNLAESLIRELTKQLASPSDAKPIIQERSKLTIVQLVIHSKKLTNVAINELLAILDKDNASASQVWNILTSFDAGSVAIDLVTNFSVSKANEIVRRANFLRFTGSVYKIIQSVIKAWQTGDKDAIAEATGAILPEVTLRKFERIELARKVQKLKMVQLSALAESLGKDVETVERLVTELIVNDELKAELQLVDDKMYLVALEEVKSSNS